MTVHLPSRPAWTCHYDGKPWPRAGARVHLLCTYDPVTLSVLTGTYLHDAVRDLDGATPPELWSRFLEWTRQPRESP